MAFYHVDQLIGGGKIYRSEDILRMVQEITLDEVKEVAARVLEKPFGMAVMGNQALLEQVPPKKKIEESMQLGTWCLNINECTESGQPALFHIPNNKPIAGSFPMPNDIKPYDVRQGQAEPLPNPVQHRGHAGAGRNI